MVKVLLVRPPRASSSVEPEAKRFADACEVAERAAASVRGVQEPVLVSASWRQRWLPARILRRRVGGLTQRYRHHAAPRCSAIPIVQVTGLNWPASRVGWAAGTGAVERDARPSRRRGGRGCGSSGSREARARPCQACACVAVLRARAAGASRRVDGAGRARLPGPRCWPGISGRPPVRELLFVKMRGDRSGQRLAQPMAPPPAAEPQAVESRRAAPASRHEQSRGAAEPPNGWPGRRAAHPGPGARGAETGRGRVAK